jgi:hypothetical protein
VGEYLSKGLYYSDEDFKLDALLFHERVLTESEEAYRQGTLGLTSLARVRQFKCTPPFIQDFRRRHYMTLRRPNFKRRPSASQEQIDAFTERVRALLDSMPRERVLNLDETHWKAVAAGFLTWASVSAESVSAFIANDAKQGMTVLATINAIGEKLPLMIVGQGKTDRCLAGYHLPDGTWFDKTESGWTTADVMCAYFGKLRREIFPNGPLILLLDTYAAHRCQVVRDVAELWGIDLVFIPPGCTDLLQPLDRRVFGVMKAFARQNWRREYHRTHGDQVTRPMIARSLLDAWDRITPDVIESAWEIFEPD